MATVVEEPPSLPLRALKLALFWSPVWVPILLIVQIWQLGLNNVLAEQKRLEEARPKVEAHYVSSQETFDRMSAERRAWDDPVYRERVRRARERKQSEPRPKPR